MKNFAPRKERDGKRTRYVYYPDNKGKVIKLTISHRDGGMNHWSYKTEARGIEIGITEVELSTLESGAVIEGSSPMDDINGRLLVLELARYNAKKLEQVVCLFDDKAPEIARLWREDREAGRQLLFATAEEAKKAA